MSRDWPRFNPGRIAMSVHLGYFFVPFYEAQPGIFPWCKGGICGSLPTLNGNGCGWNSQDIEVWGVLSAHLPASDSSRPSLNSAVQHQVPTTEELFLKFPTITVPLQTGITAKGCRTLGSSHQRGRGTAGHFNLCGAIWPDSGTVGNSLPLAYSDAFGAQEKICMQKAAPIGAYFCTWISFCKPKADPTPVDIPLSTRSKILCW